MNRKSQSPLEERINRWRGKRDAVLKAENDHPSAVYASVDELAEQLNIGRAAAYRGLRSGEIPAIRLNRRFVIPRSAIAKWLESAGGGGK